VINADLELTWAGLANEELLPRSHSEGPRREFKITRGLRAGYGPSGRIYDLEETIRAVPLSEAEPKAQRRDVGHRIIIKKDAAASSVVWNPWAEKAAAMADLGDVGHFFYPVL